MKKAYQYILLLLLLTCVNLSAIAQAGEWEGIYSHTSEDDNGDLYSWVFTLKGSGVEWEAQMVKASPDGAMQEPKTISQLAVSVDGGTLQFTMDSISYVGQFVETEEGKMSLVLIGDGKMMTFIR
jgi:hypothetical protein